MQPLTPIMQLQQHLLYCSSSSFEICSHNIVLSCNSSFVGICVLLRYLFLVLAVVSATFFRLSRPFFVALLPLWKAVDFAASIPFDIQLYLLLLKKVIQKYSITKI